MQSFEILPLLRLALLGSLWGFLLGACGGSDAQAGSPASAHSSQLSSSVSYSAPASGTSARAER